MGVSCVNWYFIVLLVCFSLMVSNDHNQRWSLEVRGQKTSWFWGCVKCAEPGGLAPQGEIHSARLMLRGESK